MAGSRGGERAKLAMLRGVPLFEGLKRKELLELMGASKEKSYPEDKMIVQEGTDGVGFHLILEGEAKVTMSGKRKAMLRAGDYFGEISVIDGGPRTASVISTTPIRVLSITSWAFMPLATRNPAVARRVMLTLCTRLREARHDVVRD
jgi:CRP/FNR family transcriptional regulator, cyclic AMP receptor protein